MRRGQMWLHGTREEVMEGVVEGGRREGMKFFPKTHREPREALEQEQDRV